MPNIFRLGIQIRNMKMVFNIYGTWRRVTFEKLMMKMYDFSYSAKSFSLIILCKKSSIFAMILEQYLAE